MAGNICILASLVFGFAFTAPNQSDDKRLADKARSSSSRLNVAILIYDEMELLDFAGPAEVFQVAGQARGFRLYTVSDDLTPIVSQNFVKITPQYSITDCPHPDIVVIPGGNSTVVRQNKKLMEWVKRVSHDARHVFSVCTGSFVLAQAGLLDGLEATTHHNALANMRLRYPKVKVRDDRRVVDNGKIVTSAGVSAGIDGALHVVAKICGLEAAKSTARSIEYRWQPEPSLQSATNSN